MPGWCYLTRWRDTMSSQAWRAMSCCVVTERVMLRRNVLQEGIHFNSIAVRHPAPPNYHLRASPRIRCRGSRDMIPEIRSEKTKLSSKCCNVIRQKEGPSLACEKSHLWHGFRHVLLWFDRVHVEINVVKFSRHLHGSESKGKRSRDCHNWQSGGWAAPHNWSSQLQHSAHAVHAVHAVVLGAGAWCLVLGAWCSAGDGHDKYRSFAFS